MAAGDGFNNVVNGLVTFLTFGKVNATLVKQQGDQSVAIAKAQAEADAARAASTQKSLMIFGIIAGVLLIVAIGSYAILKDK